MPLVPLNANRQNESHAMLMLTGPSFRTGFQRLPAGKANPAKLRYVTPSASPWLDIRVAVTEPCSFTLTTYPLRPSPAITTKPYSRRRKKADDPDSPYLLIQRQSEDPDDHLCYVETHDEKYIGHFILRRVEFTLHGCQLSSIGRMTISSTLPSRWHPRISRKHCGQ